MSDLKERARAPVYVRYSGYASEHDEWVGADRLRSKFLMLHEPSLQGHNPERGSSVQHSNEPELHKSNSEVADGSNALPWHELDSEADAFDYALHAAEEALGKQAHTEPWQPQLEESLASVEKEALRGVLEKHSWSGWARSKMFFQTAKMPEYAGILRIFLESMNTKVKRKFKHFHIAAGQQFAHSPHLEGLLDDLVGISGLREDSDSQNGSDSEPSIPPSNDMESSCAAAPNDWEDRMARQTLGCHIW